MNQVPAEQQAPAGPPGGLSIRKNTLYAVLGNGLLNAARFGVIAILAKFTTPEIVGSFHFAGMVLAAPVVLFLGLELRAAYVADIRSEHPLGLYRALRQAGMAIAIPVLAALVLWFGRDASSPGIVVMMLAVCAARTALQLAEVEWGVYQRHERLDLLCLSNVLRSAALFAPFAILVPIVATRAPSESTSATGSLSLAAAGAAVAYTIGLVIIWRVLDVRYVRRAPGVDLNWRAAHLPALLRQTLPLGLVILLIALCDAVPPWVMKRATGGLNEVGYYGALRIITLGAGFLIVQLGNAAANRLATTYQCGSAAFVRLALRLALATLAVGGGLFGLTWLFGQPFLRVVYREDYAAYFPEFLILVGAQAILLLGSMFGFVVTNMRRFWVQVPIHLAVLSATTIAAWLWIPDDPVRGGAWTQMVRAVVQTSLFLVCVIAGMRGMRRPLSTRKENPARKPD